MQSVSVATALAGQGLQGDRYATETGREGAGSAVHMRWPQLVVRSPPRDRRVAAQEQRLTVGGKEAMEAKEAMKAIRIHGRGGPDHLVFEDAPQPRPGAGEVLARVAATAVIANELRWDETYQTAEGLPRPLPIPGPDFAGVVVEVGAGVTDFAVGDAVYALLAFGRDGAEAQLSVSPENS